MRPEVWRSLLRQQHEFEHRAERLNGWSARCRKSQLKFFQRFEPTSTDKQPRTLPRESDCGCSADAGTCAGDKYSLSLKRCHNLLYPKKRKAARGGLRHRCKEQSTEASSVLEQHRGCSVPPRSHHRRPPVELADSASGPALCCYPPRASTCHIPSPRYCPAAHPAL